MPGQALHQFDAFLCRHARDNVNWNLDHERIAARVARLDPKMAAYIQATQEVSPVGEFLLTDEDLEALYETTQGLSSSPLWLTEKGFYHDIPACTAEIRQHLSASDAELWSEQSHQYRSRLIKKNLPLSQGLEIIRELIALIRNHIRAMGQLQLLPQPAGGFPTPINPEPKTVTYSEDKKLNAAANRMRQAISEHERGKEVKPSVLIRLASINKQLGRKALRLLEAKGEYNGFQDSKADQGN